MSEATAESPSALAVVTGASVGIGRELARILATHGHALALVARDASRLDQLASELTQSFGVTARAIPLDLTEPEAPETLMAELGGEGTEVEILINNAGFGMFGPFARTPLDATASMIQLNITALTCLTRLVLPGMVGRGRGRIMNVASTAAFQPGPLMSVYYASKAYVLHFSEALADELRDTGVTVTALCPGPTRTEFQSRAQMQDSGLLQGPLLMDAETVARIGYAGMIKGKRVVIPGLGNRLLALGPRIAPRRLVTWAVRAIQAPRGR
jgi:short-subunit dehydrogenase